MFLPVVAPDLVCLSWLGMALFHLEFTDPLRRHWFLIFYSTHEPSVTVLNFIFSFKMSCYPCGGGKKGTGSGNDSGLRGLLQVPSGVM